MIPRARTTTGGPPSFPDELQRVFASPGSPRRPQSPGSGSSDMAVSAQAVRRAKAADGPDYLERSGSRCARHPDANGQGIVGGRSLLESTDPVSTAERFLASANRPARRRCPPVEQWRNERIVFERTLGSAQLTAAALDLEGFANAASASQGKTQAAKVASQEAQPVICQQALKKRSQPNKASAQVAACASPQKSLAVASKCRPRGQGARDCAAGRGEAASAPSEVPVEASAAFAELITGSSAVLCDPNAETSVPLRSVLRHRPCGLAAASQKEPATSRHASVCFAEGPSVTNIKNYSHLSGQLWYAGFAVECDRCEAPVKWGLDGHLMGSPGRSRFSQRVVLCDSCLCERCYSDIGAWLVVALAASANGSHAAAAPPVMSLIDSLLEFRGVDRKLAAVLGPAVEVTEVRQTVLQKARSRVTAMLGIKQEAWPAIADSQDDAHEDTLAHDHDGELEGSPSSTTASSPLAKAATTNQRSRPTQ